MTPDDPGLVSSFNLHWKDQRVAALKTRIGVIEKELKVFHDKVVEIFNLTPYHLNELKELKALLEDKADDKDERKRLAVMADIQREHDRTVRLSLEEQRLALRALKRRVVPTAVPPAFVEEKKKFSAPVPKPPAPKPSAPAAKKPVAKKPPAKKQKAHPPAVVDAAMEEYHIHYRDSAAPDTEDIAGGDQELRDIAEQAAEEENDEEDEGDADFIAPSDEDSEEKVDPAMYEPPHPPLSRENLMLYYGLSQKKRNDLWDLRREAAREDDPDTRRDLYEDADAALYEAIRLLKMKEDAAASRKADLARRAQEQSGISVVLPELDEKHQDPEPSLKQPGVVSRLMSGVAGMNPFQRG